QAVPFATLQSWIDMTVARNPQLKSQGAVIAKTSAVQPVPPVVEKTPPASPFKLNNSTPTPPPESPVVRAVPLDLSPLPGAGATPAPRPVATASSPVSPASPPRVF